MEDVPGQDLGRGTSPPTPRPGCHCPGTATRSPTGKSFEAPPPFSFCFLRRLPHIGTVGYITGAGVGFRPQPLCPSSEARVGLKFPTL